MSSTKSIREPVTQRELRWYICEHYNISHSSMNNYCRGGWTPEEVLEHFAKKRRKGTTAAAARAAGLRPQSVSQRMIRTDETREEAIAKMALRTQKTETYHACLKAGMTKSVAMYRAYKLCLSPEQALDYKSRGRCKPVMAFGQEWPSLSELCRTYDTCRTSVDRRIRVNRMSIEDAILAKGNTKKLGCVRVRVFGEEFKSVQEACKHFEVPTEVYGARREQGWARWTACSTHENRGISKIFEPIYVDGVESTKSEALERYGVPPEMVEKRLEHGWGTNRAYHVPPVITFYSREPVMFPDELRTALTKYDEEALQQGDCLIWPGLLAKTGAIELYAMRKRYSVPRLLYCRLHDIAPSDLSPRISVKQSCGNPYCVLPEHQAATVGRRQRGPLDREAQQAKQLEQETEADLIPPEVLSQARALLSSGFGMDIGTVATTLGLDSSTLRTALGGK